MSSNHRARMYLMAAMLVLQATRLANTQQISGTVSNSGANSISGIFVTRRNLSIGVAATVLTDQLIVEYHRSTFPRLSEA